MATNASSFSPMSSQPQYQQQLPQPQQAADNNSPLPAYLQQNQNNAANPTPAADLPGMAGMPGMSPESKVGGGQPQQQIALPQQANTDSFTFNKKDATTPQSPAFGKKEKKDSCKDDAKFGEEDDKKKADFAPKAKSPFTQAPSFGWDEKKDKE